MSEALEQKLTALRLGRVRQIYASGTRAGGHK